MQFNVTTHVSGDTLYFYAQTSDPSSDGDAADAASPPAYRIYRHETGTAVATGTMALLDDANTTGFYSEAVSLAGYDPGVYVIRLTASVGTSDGATLTTFQVGGAGPLLVRTTIATLASQTSFTLAGGPAEDNAIRYCTIVVRDSASVDQICFGYISAYTGSTKTVTLAADPAIFTMAVGDFVEVWAPTAANVRLWNATAVPSEHTAGYPIVTVKDGTGTGEINTNGGKVVGVELVDTLTTYTSNTPQTGDAYARLGAPAGASVSADIADLPTNAELATSQAAADDATLAAIAALNNITAADVWASATRTLTTIDEDSTALDLDATIRTAVGLAAANLDTQLGDLPTVAEFEARTLVAASYGTAANQTTIIADTTQIKADLPTRPTRGVQLDDVMFMMVDETDGKTPETGITVTATVSKDGGAFAACTNSVSEVSGGWYKITLTATELTANGVALKMTGTGCAQTNIVIRTQPT